MGMNPAPTIEDYVNEICKVAGVKRFAPLISYSVMLIAAYVIDGIAKLFKIRGIDPLEVKEALLNGEIIEDYPEDKRGHSCLVYGKTRIGKDIHVLCGTAYDIL